MRYILVTFLVGGLALIYFGWNYDRDVRRQEHVAPVHEDVTTIETTVNRQIEDGEVALIFRQESGRVIRIIADEDAASSFINSVLLYVSNREQRVNEQITRDLDAVFTRAFASADSDLEAYADWHFAWLESWNILRHAITGALEEAISLSLSIEKTRESARHEVERYFMRNFSERVLRAEFRDPVIKDGVLQIVRDAHAELQLTIASLDDQVQKFISEHSNYDEVINPDNVINVKLDWDAARWKAPIVNAESYVIQGVQSVGLVAFTTVTLSSTLEAIIAPLLAETVASVMASTELAVGGAVLGSEVPILGNLAGAAVGLLLDKAISLYRESMTRDDFSAANRLALNAVVDQWKQSLKPKLHSITGTWFSDVSQAVALIQ